MTRWHFVVLVAVKTHLVDFEPITALLCIDFVLIFLIRIDEEFSYSVLRKFNRWEEYDSIKQI